VLDKQIGPTDMEAIKAACEEPKVKEAVLKDLDKAGRRKNFAGYERVKNIKLYVEPFTVENELLTPTLKLKRPVAAKKYRGVLDQLYAEALEKEKKSGLKAKL
jgi:long-chain acyl-CoA synthetase